MTIAVDVKSPASQRDAAAGGPSDAVAVLVCHGMGQQVPFETIDGVAAALHRRSPAGGGSSERPRVQLVRHGDDWLPRAELTLARQDGSLQVVHLYEAYWAPITEGRVGGLDVVRFLLGAGRRGITFCMRGVFDRSMFGDVQEFRLSRFTLMHLVLATLVVALLAFWYATFWVLAGAHALAWLSALPSNGGALGPLTRLVWWYAVVAIGLVLVGALTIPLRPLYLRLSSNRRGDHRLRVMLDHGKETPLPRPTRLAQWAVIAATLALALLVGWGAARVDWPSRAADAARWPFAWALAGEAPGSDARPIAAVAAGVRWIAAALSAGTPPVAVLLGLLLAAYVANRARNFFVQFVGDVAAYVSAHTVSRFYDIRRQVQEASYRIATFVYGARSDDGRAPAYDRVIVVGHSLGSVVAYDTLNEMLKREEAGVGGAERVADRTDMLLTFGSPLDKTAFIFRTQADTTGVREGLAAAVQPMIQSYAWRPRRWVNIWSPADWISGQLEYYDTPLPPDHPDESKPIDNKRDLRSWWFPVAHNQYWSGETFARTLYKAVTTPRSDAAPYPPAATSPT